VVTNLANLRRKRRISANPGEHVSREARDVSRKNDVQTITWHLSRDSAFLLLSPFFYLLPSPSYSAQRRSRDTMPLEHRIPA
jgi:hypothetical protein